LQKINRNKEFLKIIGLDQPAIAVERKKKTDSDPSKKTKKRKEPSNDYLEFMERRKSQRLSTKPTIKYIEIEGNNGEFVSKKRRVSLPNGVRTRIQIRSISLFFASMVLILLYYRKLALIWTSRS
jgi:hypothetical protein